MTCRYRTVLSHAALALLITGGLLYAGPLNPPAGPVMSTYKTLTEVEPRVAINAANTPGDANSLFKITQRGSYYLTGNITGVVGKHGIEIAASGVTLDLNGFDLVGVPAMGLFDGVSVTEFDQTNIAVINGSVRNWGSEGVDLNSITSLNCRVARVLASGNARTGISIGLASTVNECSAYNNGLGGIITNSSCTITHCAASNNINAGIAVGSGCTVTDCSTIDNFGAGITAGVGSTLTSCTANSNGGDGITSGSCTISNCSVSGNGGFGIYAGANASVTHCASNTNGSDGIRGVLGCLISGNTCNSNGAAGLGSGIHTTSTDNRIEGNNCILADRGISTEGAGNIIIKNTCSGNTTNWSIFANNYYGPIIDRTGIATASVNGAAAAGTLVTTDPNANFSY